MSQGEMSHREKCRTINCKVTSISDLQLQRIAEHLEHGDSRAAIVVSTDPELLIAAYTDESDWERTAGPTHLGNLQIFHLTVF